MFKKKYRQVKKTDDNIQKYNLNPSFYKVHKDVVVGESQFGLDNTDKLIAGGFGLYSSAGLKQKIGPIKSEFYRIGFGVTGTVELHCGLEQFHFSPDCIAFTFPGQIFSLHDKSADLYVYYMLFTEDFIADAISLKRIREDFPFFNYSGQPAFQLRKAEAEEIHHLILKINREIQERNQDLKPTIQLYIHLILLQAKRSYDLLELPHATSSRSDHNLLIRYKKLVSQHLLSQRKVTDYAAMLQISASHLNKVVKQSSGKNAHEFIEEMLLLEAKALLLHSSLSVAEIAYQLEFTDPSHFNKFFKKLTGKTPQAFRKP